LYNKHKAEVHPVHKVTGHKEEEEEEEEEECLYLRSPAGIM